MKLFYIFFAIFAGAGLAVDGSTSYSLQMALDNPFVPGMVSCIICGIVLTIIIKSQKIQYNMESIKSVPKWTWLVGGAVLAFYYVAITFASSVVGISAIMVALIAGQVGSGMLWDSFGIMGVPVRRLSMLEYIGGAMTTAGAIMMVYAKF